VLWQKGADDLSPTVDCGSTNRPLFLSSWTSFPYPSMILPRCESGSFAHRASSKQHISRYFMALSPCPDLPASESAPVCSGHTSIICLWHLPMFRELADRDVYLADGSRHASQAEDHRQCRSIACFLSNPRGQMLKRRKCSIASWLSCRPSLSQFVTSYFLLSFSASTVSFVV
jgi:hypothetical protein